MENLLKYIQHFLFLVTPQLPGNDPNPLLKERCYNMVGISWYYFETSQSNPKIWGWGVNVNIFLLSQKYGAFHILITKIIFLFTIFKKSKWFWSWLLVFIIICLKRRQLKLLSSHLIFIKKSSFLCAVSTQGVGNHDTPQFLNLCSSYSPNLFGETTVIKGT